MFDEAGEARIVRDYKSRLGHEVNVTITRVDQIPPEKSGKFRYVVSHVSGTTAIKSS
jgi:phenylacetate-CoA ligase